MKQGLRKAKAILALCFAAVIAGATLLSPASFLVEAEMLHGVVSIAFDDNYLNQFDYAFPLMQSRGIVGTFYVLTDNVGKTGYMSFVQLQTLQSGGNEIGSHSKSHVTLTSLSETQIRQECSYSKQVLQNYGLAVTNFAFPNGHTNATVDSIVSEYYRSGRTAYEPPYLMEAPTSQFRLAGFSAETGDSTALSLLKGMVDQVFSTNGWAVIFFHNIVPGANSQPYTTSAEDFASFLDYVISKGVRTMTVDQVLDLTPNIKTWYWTDDTVINAVAGGDVNGDGDMEIVTGGSFNDDSRINSQLVVWDGASLALENVKTWYWTDDTDINSVAVGDIDGDGNMEIVTVGDYYDGTRSVAQLCVWNGDSLALQGVQAWYWVSWTAIDSVAVGDVDGDGGIEIVTGGDYYDGTRPVAQLCVWNGATLTLEKVKTWYWTSNTDISSVAVGDVDGDTQTEIITGGYYYDNFRDNAQLCVWEGATLALEKVKTWYWTSNTDISSVTVGDVDGDTQTEIVTGGEYYDGVRDVAQLCVWNGGSLELEKVEVWHWPSDTHVSSIAVGDVDGDAQMEIVTGGEYHDGTRYVAHSCLWSGTSLELENLQTWYSTSNTFIWSVGVGDVDNDTQMEIVTGGEYLDGTRYVAQLVVWA